MIEDVIIQSNNKLSDAMQKEKQAAIENLFNRNSNEFWQTNTFTKIQNDPRRSNWIKNYPPLFQPMPSDRGSPWKSGKWQLIEGSYFSALQKAYAVSKGAPEVVFKITKGPLTNLQHLLSHGDYITRGGKLEATDEHGLPLSKEEVREKLMDMYEAHRQWKIDHPRKRACGRQPSIVARTVISMPVGTDWEKFQRGVEDFVCDEIASGGYPCLVEWHRPETDPYELTHQPHAHITIGKVSRNPDMPRFQLNPKQLPGFREALAVALCRTGLEVSATPARSRGVAIAGYKTHERYHRKRYKDAQGKWSFRTVMIPPPPVTPERAVKIAQMAERRRKSAAEAWKTFYEELTPEAIAEHPAQREMALVVKAWCEKKFGFTQSQQEADNTLCLPLFSDGQNPTLR